MTRPPDVNTSATPLTHDQITAALLEITGDLDKAQVLQNAMPRWLISAKPHILQALEEAHERGASYHARAAQRLRQLEPLERFCTTRLTAFLAAKGHASLDVERDTLEIPIFGSRPGSHVVGPLVQMVDVQQHSLLQAAMQNFSEALAAPDGLELGTLVRSHATRQVVQELPAETFVKYVRELDLGRAYQEHLREVFNLAVSAGTPDVERAYNAAVRDIGQCKTMEMQVDLHLAQAKGHISDPVHTVLLAVIRADQPASQLRHLSLNGGPLIWQGLSLYDACLWSVLVFSNESAGGLSSGPILVYMPGEPERPWYSYTSLADFKTYLTLKLQVKTYREFFTRYLDESERHAFFTRFDQSLSLERVEPLVVASNLSQYFFNACTRKLQLDAQLLVVPTAQADEEASEKRLQSYLDTGLTLLNVASFFVPVLGELMMGVGVGQMLGEVYDGIEDWTHGDKSEALSHLVNVAESLAGMALFAVGGAAVTRLGRRLKISSQAFFDKMEVTRMPDASPRLWRRNLAAYRPPEEIGPHVLADARGIYQANGQSYARIEGVAYSIAFDTRLGQWVARHPRRAAAYPPPLLHNRQGGWRFSFEDPEQWQAPSYILGRINPALEIMPAEHLADITTITGMSVTHLRYLAAENRMLPERFRDCVVRFRQNQQIRDLIWELEHQPTPGARTARTQLMALPLMPGWPKGRFFEVLDSEGSLLERYPDPAPFDYEDLSIHITDQQVKSGQVIPTLLGALDAKETHALLEGKVALAEQPAALQRQLLASLRKTHRQVYERLYEQVNVSTHPDHTLLMAHYPKLPNRLAWEVLAKTSILHRWQLRKTGRVPLKVAQQAEQALNTFDEDRALEGLFLPELATDDTYRVAAGLLPDLAGWPTDLSLQLRNDATNGSLLRQIGEASAPLSRKVVKSARGFQAFDETGQALGEITEGPEGFYQAVLDTLSPAQRTTMDLSQGQAGGRLRHQLISKVQDDRPRLTRALWPERVQPRPPQARCVQAAPPEPVSHPAALMRKVKKLYPLFNPEQISTFLQARGDDHLSRAKAVQALERQFEALHRALKQWRNEKSALAELAHLRSDYRLSRQDAAEAIENCWKQMTFLPDAERVKVPSLVLDGMAVGRLPVLPPEVSFPHVQQLSLNQMQLNDEVGYFLKHFKGVVSLDLRDNRLTRLPEVLSQMPDLKRLYLDNNRLQLTEFTRSKLAGLQGLQVLDLSGNPLVDPPDVGRMFDLRSLVLRNCRLKVFPAGILRIPHLSHIDLRMNDIVTLPGWLAEASRNVARSLNLRHNPLDTSSRLLLHTYRSRVGIGMGFLEDDIARLHESRARELWLGESTEPATVANIATWAGLRDEPRSEGLFTLLASLGGTADTQHVREDLHRRVWRVLDATRSDSTLREEIFERAATPLNCDDAAAVSFSNLEVLVEVHEASQLVEGGQLTAKPLLRLGKGLFRLDQLEHFARRHSDEHPNADPLEVSLAFRTGLVDKFYLPGQPRHMRFARLSGVTEQTLSSAEGQLKTAEMSPALLRYLVKLPLWQGYLKRTYSAGFDALRAPYEERLHAVFDQVLTLDDNTYREQMNAILNEQQTAEKAELERLTQEELKWDELLGCELRIP